jgi:phage regulator Rha-like protein
MTSITLEVKGKEYRVDSRLIADNLGIKHKSVMQNIRNHEQRFKKLGLLPFEMALISRGRPVKYVLLNEDQAYYLLSLSSNTDRVADLKLRMVKAFAAARKNIITRETEYLPTYHALHDGVARLSTDSSKPHFVHSNINRLINKTAGIEAGTRSNQPLEKTSMLVVAQTVAIKAMANADDHRDGYKRAKQALKQLKQAIEVVEYGEIQR